MNTWDEAFQRLLSNEGITVLRVENAADGDVYQLYDAKSDRELTFTKPAATEADARSEADIVIGAFEGIRIAVGRA